jgi:hypothetical protein
MDEILTKQKNMRNFRIGHILAKLAKVPPSKVEKILDRAWRDHTGPNRIFAGDILIKAGIVNKKQVDRAQEIQEKLRKKKIGDLLVECGCLNEDKVYIALAEKFRRPYIDLESIDPSEDAKSYLPRNLALKLMVLPITIDNDHLVLATSNPEITQTVDELRNHLDCSFELVVVSPSQLKAALVKKYGN